MTDNDADRIRDAIQRDQTSCRCGHLLAACADCRDWLLEHSPRIALNIASWWRVVNEYADIQTEHFRQHVRHVDTLEAEDRAYFGL